MRYHPGFKDRGCSNKLPAGGSPESVFSFARRIRILLFGYLVVFLGTVRVYLHFEILNGFVVGHELTMIFPRLEESWLDHLILVNLKFKWLFFRFWIHFMDDHQDPIKSLFHSKSQVMFIYLQPYDLYLYLKSLLALSLLCWILKFITWYELIDLVCLLFQPKVFKLILLIKR